MGTHGDDDITAQGVAANSVDVWVNDGPRVSYIGVATVNLQGKNGDDDFDVDFALIALATAITIDGGLPSTGGDLVTVTGTDGTVDSFTWTPATANNGTLTTGTGQSLAITNAEALTIDGEDDGDTLTVTGTGRFVHTPGNTADAGQIALNSLLGVSYVNLGAAGTVTANGTGGSDILVANATNGDDTFDVSNLNVVDLTSNTGNHVDLLAGTIESLTLVGFAGQDTFNVNGANTFTAINVQGGSGDADDTLNLSNNAGAAAINLGTSTITGYSGTLTYTGLATINANVNVQNLTVTATGGDDTVDVTPADATSGVLQANGASPVVNYSNLGATFTVNGGGGEDTLVVHGNETGETFTITDALVTVGGQTVNYSLVEALTVDGQQGNDIFNVTPGAVPIFIDGGQPVGMGDTLNLIPAGVPTFSPGPEGDEGGFAIVGANPVSFDHIEAATVNLAGVPGNAAFVMGTGDDDEITAWGVAANSANVVVNNGPIVNYFNAMALTLQGKQGDDDITVDLEVAGLDIVFNVQGGLSEESGDRLRVTGVDGVNDGATWTPTTPESGTFSFTAQDNVNVTDVEIVIYDGESDDELFTVNGPAAAATRFVHTPTNAADGGRIDITDIGNDQRGLGVEYADLGLMGAVQFNGTAATTDALIAVGTTSNDDFRIEDNATVDAQVDLRSIFGNHVNLLTNSIEQLTAEGLDGDDDFTVNMTGITGL